MIRVLLVDDEPPVAKALGRVLKRAGFEVELAASGAEALEKASAGAPDIVISDFRMSGMDGAELLAQIKKQCPLTLRLMLSGYADSQSLLTAIHEGDICRFLAKPWEEREIVALLHKLVAERDLLASLRPIERPVLKS